MITGKSPQRFTAADQSGERITSGRVIEEQKNYYLIDIGESIARATIRGVLKKEKKRVCTGDIVDIGIINREPLEALILSIHERTTWLPRPPLANLSRVFLICTIREPETDLEAIDRFLFTAAAYSIISVLVFNKTDILNDNDKPELDRLISVYEKAGYRTILTSAKTGLGIDSIAAAAREGVSAVAGISGVGKTSIMKCLFQDRDFRTGELSGATGRGTHTTTNVSLLPLPNGGYMADTPGFAFVDVPEVPEEDVVTYFPELEREIGKCRFNNCIHDGEPGCHVQELIDIGEIAPWRRDHYLKLFHEMRDRRREYRGKEK